MSIGFLKVTVGFCPDWPVALTPSSVATDVDEPEDVDFEEEPFPQPATHRHSESPQTMAPIAFRTERECLLPIPLTLVVCRENRLCPRVE